MTDRTARGRLPLLEFIHRETTGGVVLLTATAIALVWANVGPGTYADVWAWRFGPASPLHLQLDLHAWVNEALMSVFFFVVALEIKRELVAGELRSPRRAALPIIAALGGMVVPAALYAAINIGGDGLHGWGIPMATDIAFVLGALAIVGTRAPAGLRLFLLAVAIVDDIGAIIVIAIFYSGGIDFVPLCGAVGVIVVCVAMRRVGISHAAAYVPPALVLWFLTDESGLHATIAGVALGLLTPARAHAGRSPLGDLEHWLHPVSALLVVPLFALANAGMTVRLDLLRDAATSAVSLGIVVGLVIGKTIGISAATLIARRLHIAELPPGLKAHHVDSGAALAGIGFTVALFISDLSFHNDPRLAETKLAVLVSSIVAVALGTSRLNRSARPN